MKWNLKHKRCRGQKQAIPESQTHQLEIINEASIPGAIKMPACHIYPRTEVTSINALEITHVQMWNKIIKAMP
jgi:hypothetical protein